jgi:hypothetical protein
MCHLHKCEQEWRNTFICYIIWFLWLLSRRHKAHLQKALWVYMSINYLVIELHDYSFPEDFHCSILSYSKHTPLWNLHLHRQLFILLNKPVSSQRTLKKLFGKHTTVLPLSRGSISNCHKETNKVSDFLLKMTIIFILLFLINCSTAEAIYCKTNLMNNTSILYTMFNTYLWDSVTGLFSSLFTLLNRPL